MDQPLDRLSDAAIAEIEVRLSETTPGPWVSYIEGRDHTSGSSFIQTADDDIYLLGASTADQDFIASARQDIPRLLHEVRLLRQLLQHR